MNSSYLGLGVGIAFAVLLVYFLMVVNFQSWLDAFIIIRALPGALTGIVWMLFLTRTTISVPALMGAIMCIGVATSIGMLPMSLGLGDGGEENAPLGRAVIGGLLVASFLYPLFRPGRLPLPQTKLRTTSVTSAAARAVFGRELGSITFAAHMRPHYKSQPSL